ncbi:MAG TPA: SDR family oxidoreductase [Marmoricola sp.]|nr:SDR family oxidoreductase [Marmoricola sp.]
MKLAGRLVAVTGGARGIGEATAVALIDAGARVVIGDRDLELAEGTAARIGAVALSLDVTDLASWGEFVSAVGEPIDVLVNNAGIMPIGDLLKEPDEVTRRIFEVNTFGVINGVKAVAPGMVERGSGHIVNVASAVGRVPMPGGASYSASKHAVVGFSEAMRQELLPSGVDVSVILPGIVRTELAAGLKDSKFVAPVTASDVAAVILDVIANPVPEAWVPRYTQRIVKVTNLLPRRVQEAIAKVAKADRVFLDLDESARVDYEARARGR